MPSADLDAVTLDAFGTLIELEDPVERLQAALAERGVACEARRVSAAFAAEVDYYLPRASQAVDETSLHELRTACVEVFLEHAGADLDPESFVEPFMASLVFRPIEGVAEALGDLRAHGLKLAVVSNWDFTLPDTLRRVGLADHFDAIVSSAEAGADKPDPAIFVHALGRLGVAPERALHVGDGEADAKGARAAGLRFAPAPVRDALRDALPERAATEAVNGTRLAIWWSVVLLWALLLYGQRFGSDEEPADDLLFTWNFALISAFSTALFLTIGLLLAYGRPDLLALRRPVNIARGIMLAVGGVVAIWILAALLNAIGFKPDEEQGLLNEQWYSGRLAPFVVNVFFLTAGAAVTEELWARGVGFGLMRPLGPWIAIGGTAVGWMLMHGLLEGAPLILLFGVVLGLMRERTRSVVPGIVLHALFNGAQIALVYLT